MTDSNAELAFLQSLQSGAAPPYSNGNHAHGQADQDDEDYDPTSLIPEAAYDPAAPLDTSDQTSTPGSMPQSPNSRSANPTPVNATGTPAATSTETGSTSAKQPRTVGGFVVDDDEEEDDKPVSLSKVAGSHGMANIARGSETPQRSISQTPNNAFPSQDVSIHKPEEGVHTTGAAETASILSNVPVDTGASAQDATVKSPTVTSQATVSSKPVTSPAGTQARLPNDRVGIFEDRIADDPRGDLDAWLGLISEHRKRGKLDEARAVYERFFAVFPTAAEQWVEYARMELENDELGKVETIFTKSLMSNFNVELWSLYLDYVRRVHNLTTDTTGQARQTINTAFDFVLSKIGIDFDSGRIWEDYVQFIKSGPGVIGGSSWQDQQKMDTLRKTFQRAVCIPHQATTTLWTQYHQFETGVNKLTGRKFLTEKSPAYMTARAARLQLENLTRDIKRTTLPRLPPALGFDGDEDYKKQVDLWKKWIEWEKEDQLVLKEDDAVAYKTRVVYVYKQALMALRFWPEMWYEAAEFCFQNDLESEGNAFLTQGIQANPESCLLSFKQADRIELTSTSEGGEEGLVKRGKAVREPYDRLLDALYELHAKAVKREEKLLAAAEETMAQREGESPAAGSNDEDGDEDDSGEDGSAKKEAMLRAQKDAIKKGCEAELKLLSRLISFTWIALMRAMRRVQGKGKPGAAVGGHRQIFADARQKGRITSDVYAQAALIEYHCYKDGAATKIFERGMTLFKHDEVFALEYLKHLVAINDITNARSVFATTVQRLSQKPEHVPKLKPIFAFFHDYESRYGELSQITELEKQMSRLFPEDPALAHFSHRFSYESFDPTAIRPIISPATQTRPKHLFPPVPAVVERAPSVQDSPRPVLAQTAQATNSPKRPFIAEDTDSEPPRKFIRAESPLKGAAGRRLDAARRNMQRGTDGTTQGAPPAPLPKDVVYILSIIPPASTWHESMIFNPQKMVQLLANIDLSRANPTYFQGPSNVQAAPSMPISYPYGNMSGAYGYNR